MKKVLLSIIVLLPCALQAKPKYDYDGTLNVTLENDYFGGTDKNYTNGFRIAWLSPTERNTDLTDELADDVLDAERGSVVRQGYSFGHSIFTPNDIEATNKLDDQHPYAGWTYLEYTVLDQKRDEVDQLTFQVGFIGPASAGETIQNEVHRFVDAKKAEGWDNQLQDEVTIGISYDVKLRSLLSISRRFLSADFTPAYGITLGNAYTNAHAGFTIRIGQDLRNDYGPPRVRPSLAGAGYFTPNDNFSWYLFAGAEGRAVLHNIFVDGSLFRSDDVKLKSRPFVVDYQAGGVVQFGDYQLSLTVVRRSDEFEAQKQEQVFGAVSLGVKF